MNVLDAETRNHGRSTLYLCLRVGQDVVFEASETIQKDTPLYLKSFGCGAI